MEFIVHIKCNSSYYFEPRKKSYSVMVLYSEHFCFSLEVL